MWLGRPAVVFIIGLCTACSSIIDGTSQQISVITNPPGANCAFHRNGEILGAVNPTPGGLLFKKTKHHIEVVCSKDGYEQARYLNKSGVQEATFGNILIGGGIGWAIDSASGADNKYEASVNLTLPAISRTAPAAPTTSNVEQRLRQLKDLFDRGVITREEHEQRRREVLTGV